MHNGAAFELAYKPLIGLWLSKTEDMNESFSRELELCGYHILTNN